MPCPNGTDGEMAMPPLNMLLAASFSVSCGASAFVYDFCTRKVRQKRKRRRIFSRRVSEYLQEFDNEVKRETQAINLQSSPSLIRDRLPSMGSTVIGDDGIPFVMTQSFRFRDHQSNDNDSLVVYKTIRVVGPIPGDRKLVVRRGASDEHVRGAMLRMYKVSSNQAVSVLYDDAPSLLCYEHIIDGGLYKVKIEQNVHRRRRTMIQQGAEANGFRYSVGVDWREVSDMLRKAVEYGENNIVVTHLHELLARHVIERLECFAADPTNEKYSIGKAVDQMDRDLRQLSLLCRQSRLAVLEQFRYSGKVGALSAAQLIDHLDNHISQRSKTGWTDLVALLNRSYLRKENLMYNFLSCALSSAAGILQPVVGGVHLRLARQVAEATNQADLQIISKTLFWTVIGSVAQSTLQQLSKFMHTKQTQVTVQTIRNTSASLMSRADQSFLDTHDVEDILSTLESDIGNIELLLRYGRGWLLDFSRIVGSSRIITCSIQEGNGTTVLLGATVGVVTSQIIQKVKILLAQQLDHIPEEEDDVQEFPPGIKVKYTGEDDRVLDTGNVLEAADEGVVVAYKEGMVTSKFAAGEYTCDEEDVQVLDMNCGMMVGGQEIDYDEVWEEESFLLARLWGKDVEEVQTALAVKDIQMKKQNEFVLVPNVLTDVLEDLSSDVPKFLMVFTAMMVLQKISEMSNTPSIFTLGSRLLLLETEAQSAIQIISKIQAEMRSLVHDSFVGARRTLHLLDHQPCIDVETGGKLAPRAQDISGKLEFRDVVFSYPNIPHKKILSGLSFTIQPGSHVALVGQSGCGKSSIFNLLSRLYDPNAGEIFLDDVPLKEYDVKHLRKKLINISMQDPYLFDGNLLSNIKYANQEATSRDVQKALKIACCDKTMERLPEGLLTTIGGGVRLSGGEQKRVGLARTLLAGAKVLLLDEPTAGLDASTEGVIKRNLQEYRKDTKTTIITISHNLSFIQDCDMILVVGDPDDESEVGTIIASGTHEELLKSCPSYARLATQSQIRSPSDTDDEDLPLGRFVEELS